MIKPLSLKKVLATLLTMAALFAGQQAWAETVTYAIDGHTETNSTGTTIMTIYASGSVTGSVTDQWNYTTTQTRTVNLPGGITFNFGSDRTSSLFIQSTALAIGATSNNGGYITLTHGSKYIYHVTLKDRNNNVIHEAWNMTKSYTYNFHEIVVKSIEVEYATAIPITDAVISGISNSYYISNAAVSPVPIVNWHGTTLTRNTHYTLSWSNNSTAGTATVTATGKGIFSPNTSVSKNYTLVWTTYTVHFDKNNDNASGTMSDQGFYYTEQKALTANGFSRMGYTFDGWSTTPNGAVEYTDSQSVSNLTAQNGATVNLYAQWTVADFETGHEGTEEDPYIIYNDDQLNMLAERVNTINNYSWHKYFKLGADITYDGTENNYTPIGIVATIMAAFQGTFDGDDHSISGIHINNNSDNQGLFGYVYNGTVKNVILRSSTITGIDNIGGIVGRLEYGTVTDCRVESTVTIGANGDGNNAARNHGGIVGYLESSTVNGCISAATVTQSGIVGYRFGGIAGRIYGNTATISNCLALGATVVVNVYPSIRGGAILGSEDGGNLVHNYYHDCTVGSASTNIGTNNGDIEQDDGAVQVFSLTLGEGITATPAPAVTYNNINYYTAGTEITLGAPQGYAITSATLTYGGNDHSIEGNSFEMPAQDVAVTAVLQAPYTFDSSTGALTLNWGEFNMDNKWGDDVNRLAVTSVTATDEVSFTGDCYKLFYGFEHCTSMDLSNVNTDGLTNISCMFWGCWSLNTLDLSSWNTAAVTAMTSAFRGCQGLTSLNLTGWNTASVTTMGHLFLECYNLATIEGISEWVPESVTNMTEMFSGCSNLQSLDLSGWNTANVTTMLEMFIGCSSLQSLDLSGWNTAKVNNMSSMFYGCSSLQSLDLSGWNTSNVWYMYGMFDGCSSLTTIYVGEGWNTSHVIDSDYMFTGCTSLVGGMGTTYDANYIDKTYARIDRGSDSEQPGYLTGRFNKDIAGYGTGTGGWYLIASPVPSITPTLANGFITDDNTDPDNLTYDLYYFDQTGGTNGKEWKNYRAHPEFTSLVSGQGYLYASKNGTTLLFSGAPYSGEGQVDLTYFEVNGNQGMWGWNLIGNPFAETANLPSDLSYYTLNDTRSELIAGNASTIGAMEAIFVKATGTGQSVQFTKQSRGGISRGSTAAVNAILSLNLTDNHNRLIDRAIVRFDEGQPLPKFQIRETSTKVYIPQDGKDYAVASADRDAARYVSTGVNEIPVNFKANENGQYTITVNAEGVDMAYLHLIDNMTSNDVDLLAPSVPEPAVAEPSRSVEGPNALGTGPSTLRQAQGSGTSYTFEARTTDYESRFRLVFSTVCEDADGDSDGTFAFMSDGNIIVNGEGTLQVIDMMGRVILSGDAINRVSTGGMTAGVYVLRLINGDDVKTQKIVVR